MKAHNARKSIRKLNRKGGIEGLPMELMIIVVVATLGCGLLVGWMGNIDTPETIGDVSSSLNQIEMRSDTQSVNNLKITVTDSDGDVIKGATVVLSGCGVKYSSKSTSVFATTDDNGVATFSSFNVTKNTPGIGYISVSVSAGDYGEDNTLRIPVVR